MASTDCGWCGRLAHMEAASDLSVVPDHWNGSIVQSTYMCPNCYRLSIAYERSNSHRDQPGRGSPGESQTYTWGPYVSWLPRTTESREFEDVPEHIASAATEATLCQSAGAYRAVGALARAVIEATAKEREVGGKDLYQRINALAEAGHLREHTKEQAHEIRHFGNDMAHGDFAAPVSAEEASEIVELMGEVLNEVYQSPARLERVREARRAKKEAGS